MSDGKYISLGYFEKEDLKMVIQYLRETQSVCSIGLWGRSMGAATAIMYASSDNTISGNVLDSPFSSFSELVND